MPEAVSPEPVSGAVRFHPVVFEATLEAQLADKSLY
jgi:hypothetical protein